jgi:hypothetical protein
VVDKSAPRKGTERLVEDEHACRGNYMPRFGDVLVTCVAFCALGDPHRSRRHKRHPAMVRVHVVVFIRLLAAGQLREELI